MQSAHPFSVLVIQLHQGPKDAPTGGFYTLIEGAPDLNSWALNHLIDPVGLKVSWSPEMRPSAQGDVPVWVLKGSVPAGLIEDEPPTGAAESELKAWATAVSQRIRSRAMDLSLAPRGCDGTIFKTPPTVMPGGAPRSYLMGLANTFIRTQCARIEAGQLAEIMEKNAPENAEPGEERVVAKKKPRSL